MRGMAPGLGLCLLAAMFSGCVGVGVDEGPAPAYGAPEWEPFTRLKVIGQIAFTLRFCFTLDGCVDAETHPERIVCDPPQLEVVRYTMAREDGTWSDRARLATPERLAQFRDAWEPGADYLRCSFEDAFHGTGTSRLPGTFTLSLDPGGQETCSFGPAGGCGVEGVVPHEVVFAGPGEDADRRLVLRATTQWAGLQDSLSVQEQQIDWFLRT